MTSQTTSKSEYEKAEPEARKLMAFGRAIVLDKAPYVAPTMLGLRPYFLPGPNPELPTLAVTAGLVLYADPVWMINEPSFQGKDGRFCFASCLYHEILHIQNEHPARMKALLGLHPSMQDVNLAQISEDVWVNTALRNGSWPLPPWVIYPEKYKLPEGKTFEWYFHELKRRQVQLPKEPGGIGAGGCGGCSGGVSAEEQKIDLLFGHEPEDVENIIERTAEAVVRNGGGCGIDKGTCTEKLNKKLEKPVVPWPVICSRLTRRLVGGLASGDDDVSYRRPSRRAMSLGMIRPGPISNIVTPVILRDTSASMNKEAINSATNQIVQIMKALGITEVYLLDGDVDLQGRPRTVSINNIWDADVLGGGGTNFTQVLDSLRTLNLNTDLVFYMTDGDGTAPKQKPSFIGNMVWCIIEASWMRRPAFWGELVVCSDDPGARERLEPPVNQ